MRATFVGLGQRIAPTPAAGEELGEELALLVEGVYGAVQTRRDPEPARFARRLAIRACERATGAP